jgi:hypothetical protein
MAKYPNMVTTKSGLAAIATANAEGKALIFTKIVLGDGDLGETAIADMTDVISRKMELPVTEGVIGSTSGQFQVVALLSNTELLSGFYIKEIAAFAKVGDDGTETLIAYTNGGAYVDYLPDKETPINSQNVILDVLVGNAESVTIAVKDETLVSQKNLSDAISNHNDDDSAHAHLLSGSNFGTAVLNHLLGSALASLVTAVSTDSLFSKLLKKALEAAGLQYNIASNGYICFGALFGGLILQWRPAGVPHAQVSPMTSTGFSIGFPNACFVVLATSNNACDIYVSNVSRAGAHITKNINNTGSDLAYIIAIGH